MKEGGEGGEGRKRLQFESRTQRLIGAASRTILTSVDQRFVS